MGAGLKEEVQAQCSASESAVALAPPAEERDPCSFCLYPGHNPKLGPPAPTSLVPPLPRTELGDLGPLLTLAAFLQSWRPMGTWFRVLSGAGTEPWWARCAR